MMPLTSVILATVHAAEFSIPWVLKTFFPDGKIKGVSSLFELTKVGSCNTRC